ncbi:MAG: cupin domain-containing protein [Chloroflexi bacterium]|nr:cupin domain-containing protein [Chloroflexota bacterium]
MFKPYAETRPIDVIPGITRRTLQYGEKMVVIEVTVEENVTMPWHSHPYEEIGTLVSGHFQVGIDDRQHEAKQPGDTWLLPAGIRHSATALSRTVLIAAFSPPREDYKD